MSYLGGEMTVKGREMKSCKAGTSVRNWGYYMENE